MLCPHATCAMLCPHATCVQRPVRTTHAIGICRRRTATLGSIASYLYVYMQGDRIPNNGTQSNANAYDLFALYLLCVCAGRRGTERWQRYAGDGRAASGRAWTRRPADHARGQAGGCGHSR
eukprot:515942-Rhodomonas_salina.1